jgi:hypothetical protein
VPSEVELAMGPRLQSNGATQAVNVDTSIPSAIFPTFLSTKLPGNSVHETRR